MHRKVLLVDDDSYSTTQLKKLLETEELSVEAVSNGQEALTALTATDYSVLITDLRMPGMGGMDLIREVSLRRLMVTTIVTTSFGSIERVVEAMRLGAYDFLTKPIDPTQLQIVMDRALKKRELQDEVLQLRQQLKENYSFHNIISKSPEMHKIFQLIRHIGGTKSTVLIEGETGTGKELIAKAVHYSGEDRTGNLVSINCAALPESLLESELFGHEQGPFTSADARRKGRFELADKGTIFLDEIGDISPAMQAKLLRVLQEKRFERVGGHESIDVDIRVVAATNKSLEKRGQGGEVPRGPLLPAQRDQDRRPAAPRPARGHPAAGHPLPPQVRPPQRAAQEGLSRGDGPAPGLPMARQHPPARERHRARRRHHRRRHDQRRQPPHPGRRRPRPRMPPSSRSTSSIPCPTTSSRRPSRSRGSTSSRPWRSAGATSATAPSSAGSPGGASRARSASTGSTNIPSNRPDRRVGSGSCTIGSGMADETMADRRWMNRDPTDRSSTI